MGHYPFYLFSLPGHNNHQSPTGYYKKMSYKCSRYLVPLHSLQDVPKETDGNRYIQKKSIFYHSKNAIHSMRTLLLVLFVVFKIGCCIPKEFYIAQTTMMSQLLYGARNFIVSLWHRYKQSQLQEATEVQHRGGDEVEERVAIELCLYSRCVLLF